MAITRRRRGFKRGFTLIELLVVTGIFAFLSAIVLANNSKFGGAITLENLAYDVALSIRQAQVYGIAVQRYGENDFSAGYGMHFSTTAGNQYELFADAAIENGKYDAGELVRLTTIRQGYKVAALYVTPSQGVEIAADAIDVLFRRPEPDACISAGSVTIDADGRCISPNIGARITVEAPRGDRADIIIEATGQVYVERTN